MQQHGDQPTKQSKLKINIWYQLYMGSFFFLRAIHAVYRSSQARGQIRATAASHTPQPQLPAYTTATARPDLNCVCKLHCSSQQHQIFNPLSVARDQTWPHSQEKEYGEWTPTMIFFHVLKLKTVTIFSVIRGLNNQEFLKHWRGVGVFSLDCLIFILPLNSLSLWKSRHRFVYQRKKFFKKETTSVPELRINICQEQSLPVLD